MSHMGHRDCRTYDINGYNLTRDNLFNYSFVFLTAAYPSSVQLTCTYYYPLRKKSDIFTYSFFY